MMTPNPLTKEFLYSFIAKHKHVVVSSVTADQKPEAAVVGIIVTPDLRIFFDTLSTTRKYANLLSNPAAAVVIGWDDEKTVQLEGKARVPSGTELDALLQLYYKVFPEGEDRNKNWPDIAYIVIDTEWVRYSDFSASEIIETKF
jgi:general stress protein 26